MFKWLERLREKRELDKYNDGYEWAAAELLRSCGNMMEELTAYVYGESSDFDRGAVAAIRDWGINCG